MDIKSLSKIANNTKFDNLQLVAKNADYDSSRISTLSPEQLESILSFLGSVYKNRYKGDSTMLLRADNVIYKKVGGEIMSCCLTLGRRIYAIAAKNKVELSKLLSEVVDSNGEVWCTVDIEKQKLINVCQKAGMNIVANSAQMESYLAKNDPRLAKNIHIINLDRIAAFTRKDARDAYPQFLMKS